MHRRSLHLVASLGSAIALAFTAAHSANGASSPKRAPTRTLLAFNSMFGVDAPFLGNTNPVHGFNGDTEPWSIRNGTGTLDTDGNLAVLIKGLVFSDNPDPTRIGKNDEEEFRAVVVCTTVQSDGTTVTESSVTTPGFHADGSGNAVIRSRVELPDPCLEPVVLVIGGESEWLAMTGFDSQQLSQNNGKNGGNNNGGGNGGDNGGSNNGGTTGGVTGGTSAR
jgi:hypothetical protein